jgi:leader peptidase (prepilin peptidase) / N-methyltransferase
VSVRVARVTSPRGESPQLLADDPFDTHAEGPPRSARERLTDAWREMRSPWWALPVGVALVVGTGLRFGVSANAAAFALVELALLALTVVDIATRRLPNLITVPSSLIVIALRAAFEPHELVTVLIVGSAALVVVGVLSIVLRGGLGMGDAKLVGMLGFTLGSTLLPALVVGVLLGGLASILLLLARRASWNSAIAYGPYLAVGGVVAILFTYPPALV